MGLYCRVCQIQKRRSLPRNVPSRHSQASLSHTKISSFSLLLRLWKSIFTFSMSCSRTQPRTQPRPRMHARLVSALCHHVYTIYLFNCNNIKDIICLGLLFGGLNASIASQLNMGPDLSLQQILASSPAMLLWSWSNLFIFNLHNQRSPSAVAEDKINKPWRPIPAGRISSNQATRIMYCMYPVILGVSFTIGGLGPCLFEAFSCLWYNEWGGASNPFLKNLLNGLGFACFFAGPLEVATRHSIFSGEGKAALWLLIFAATITTISHAQDFRDMEGDRASGRKTLPLAVGNMNGRILVAVGILGWTLLSCWFWEVGLVDWRRYAVAWAAGIAMAGNFFRDWTREGDTLSWKLFPPWMVGLFLLPLPMGIGMYE